MSDLPEEVTVGMTPVLARYGISEQTEQGKVMVEIGRVLQRSDMTGLAYKKYDLEDWTFRTATQIMVILKKHGIHGLIQRKDCAQEILKFIAELVEQEAKKQGGVK
jgi:hypothetical protein